MPPRVLQLVNGVQLTFHNQPLADATAKRLDMDTDVSSAEKTPVDEEGHMKFPLRRIAPHSRVIVDYTVYAPRYVSDTSAAQIILDRLSMESKQSSSGSDSFGSTRSPPDDMQQHGHSFIRRDRRVADVPVGADIPTTLAALRAKALKEITKTIADVAVSSVDAQSTRYSRGSTTPLGDLLEADTSRGPIERGCDVEVLVEDPRDGPLATTNIPALNEALLHMSEGQRVTVLVPAHLSFSSIPTASKIPKHQSQHPEGQNTTLLTKVGQHFRPKQADVPSDPSWPAACSALFSSLCRGEGITASTVEPAAIQGIVDTLTEAAIQEERRLSSGFHVMRPGASNVFIEVVAKKVSPEVDLSNGSRYLTKHVVTPGADGAMLVALGDTVDFFIAEDSPLGEGDTGIRSIVGFPVGGPESCSELDRMLMSMTAGEEAHFKVGSVGYVLELANVVDAQSVVGHQAIKLAMLWKERGNMSLKARNALNDSRTQTLVGVPPKVVSDLPPDASTSPFLGHISCGAEVNFNANVGDQLLHAYRSCYDQSKRHAEGRNHWSTLNTGFFGRRAGSVVGSHGRCRLLDALSTFAVRPPRQPRSFESDVNWGPPAVAVNSMSTPVKPSREGSLCVSPASPFQANMDNISMGGSDVEGSPILLRLSQQNSIDFLNARSDSIVDREQLVSDLPNVFTIHDGNEEAAFLSVLQQYELGISVLLDDRRFGFAIEDISGAHAYAGEEATRKELVKQRYQCIRDLCSNSAEVFLKLGRYAQSEQFASHSLEFERKHTVLGGVSEVPCSEQAQKAHWRRLRARKAMGYWDLVLEDAALMRRILEVRTSRGENVTKDAHDLAIEEKIAQAALQHAST